MSEPFIAEIKIFAGNYAPRGWAFCDGQLLPIAQNTALFSLIGTVYGGDGRTTTALPNMQDRAPMHPGNGPGLTNRRLGEKVGADSVTLNANQIANHSHSMIAYQNATASSPSTGVGLGNAPMYGSGTAEPMASGTLGPAGGNAGGTADPHNNVQPNLRINFIIALQGTYPSRS